MSNTIDQLFDVLSEKEKEKIHIMSSCWARRHDFDVYTHNGRYVGIVNGTRFEVRRVCRNRGLFGVKIIRRKS